MHVFLSILIGLLLMVALVIAGLAAVAIVLLVLSGIVDAVTRLAGGSRKRPGTTVVP